MSNNKMLKNNHLSSLTKIVLTINLLVATALPTIAYPVEMSQKQEETSISDYKKIYGSPCYKNPSLPQCR